MSKEPDFPQSRPTTTEVVREYAGQRLMAHEAYREQYAESAFAALYDLLAACDAALAAPRGGIESVSVKSIRNIIRENIRSAAS